MEKSTTYGMLLGLFAVGYGMYLKGADPHALINPAAFLIIFAGTFAALLNAFPMKDIKRFRERALTPERPVTRGTADNPETFFTRRESCNKYYENLPEVVEHYLGEISKITGREYHLFSYYGADDADPWSIYWLHFRGERVDMFAGIIARLIDIRESDRSRYSDRFSLFEEMYRNLETGYSPDNLEYVSFCLMHFLASLKYVNQFREIKTIRGDDIVQAGIAYMKDHLEQALTLEDIASSVGYSPSHFSALFSKRTSFAPMEYYNSLKIQRACSYLQFSTLKIKEIAFRLGYYDQFHFSKAFRGEMGLAPKEYRKRYWAPGLCR